MKHLRSLILYLLTTLLVTTVAAAHGGGTVTVQSVVPNSPAAAAGLQAGDRFVRLDGREITTYENLEKVMEAHQPGDTVPLVVERAEDHAGFAAALDRLADPDTRRRMGACARRRAESCGWDHHLDAVLALYEQVRTT